MQPHPFLCFNICMKVWDLRCSSCNRPVGVFAGHKDGISHVESKVCVFLLFTPLELLLLQKDDRYLITNSKDQTIKLWDLRKFSNCSAIERTRTSVSHQYWDYRWQEAPRTCTLSIIIRHQSSCTV